MNGSISYFEVLFVRCGTIGWLLWGLSVVTLSLIIANLITMRRGNIFPKDFDRELGDLFAAKRYHEAMDLARRGDNLLGRILHASMRESSRGYSVMERAMEDAAELHATVLLRRIEWLNLIGNIAPMLGLLGTVWGMILAFFTIVEKGGIATPADLAGAIGIKLVCTLEGLMIAIPALAVYGALRSRIETLSGEAMIRCQELISVFHPGKKTIITLGAEEKQSATGS